MYKYYNVKVQTSTNNNNYDNFKHKYYETDHFNSLSVPWYF